MAKKIEPNQKKLESYFNIGKRSVFYIPQFQRAYSWDISRCDKLWGDIKDYNPSMNGDSYFFGTVIINCEDHDNKLVIIDGQQRTITFLLLLKAILLVINERLIKFSDDDDSEDLKDALTDRRKEIISMIYGIDKDSVKKVPGIDDEIVFKNKDIINNDSINEKYFNDFTTIIQSNNYKEIEERVIKIKYQKKDNKYSNYYRNFKFFLDKINNEQNNEINVLTKKLLQYCQIIEIRSWDEEQAISIFNSLNGDNMPLSDSDIISSKLYEKSKKDGKDNEFSKGWEKLLDSIDEILDLNITIDSLLTQYMYFIRAKKRETRSEKGSIILTTPGLRRYYLEPSNQMLNEPLDLTNKLYNLSILWKKINEKTIFKVILKFNENSKLFIATYLLRDSGIVEDDLNVILECMLRLFVLLDVVDKGYSSSLFKTFLFDIQVDLSENNININNIKDKFNKHINGKFNKKEVIESIMDCEKNSLVYIKEFLYARDNSMQFDLNQKPDIEHIMPKNGKNNESIRSDANIESIEEFNSLFNKIGNKILLEYDINRSIGRNWFKEKLEKSVSIKKGYKDSYYPYTKEIIKKYGGKQDAKWTKDDINDYNRIIANRIAEFIFG